MMSIHFAFSCILLFGVQTEIKLRFSFGNFAIKLVLAFRSNQRHRCPNEMWSFTAALAQVVIDKRF